MDYAVACIVGYLLGSVPLSLLVARRHGVDLYRTGDGNPGAWNALEQLGWARAWPAFVGDALKGSLAALTGFALGDVWVAYAAVAAAMVGHAFPAFARLRGGKSVMTFVGGSLVLAPIAGAIALGLLALLSLRRGGFALGARVGVFAFPLLQLATSPVEHVAATGALMCLIGARFLASRPSRDRRAVRVLAGDDPARAHDGACASGTSTAEDAAGR
jgi:glycerol-3-phosphate acyltransferase PlsY